MSFNQVIREREGNPLICGLLLIANQDVPGGRDPARGVVTVSDNFT